MNRITMLLVLTVFFTFTVSFASVNWLTNFENALAVAKETNRYVLVDFSGSDWCGWCIRLDEEVFNTDEFGAYARENLVMVQIDFPRKKPQVAFIKQQNDELAKKYGIRGFPTVLIMSPEGKVIAQTGYQQGGPKFYIQHIKDFIQEHEKKTIPVIEE